MLGKYGREAIRHIKGVANAVGSNYVGWNLSRAIEKPANRMIAMQVGQGALSGAAMGGVTGAVDRDRHMVPGAIGGAFWGGLVGGGGATVARSAIRKARKHAAKVPAGVARQQALARTNLPRMFSNSRRNAMGLVGAYGAFGFTQGQSHKRKHYTTFHHGEYKRK